jgi:ankyrin repeat protein
MLDGSKKQVGVTGISRDVDIEDGHRTTPLAWAMYYHWPQAARLLLKAGANPQQSYHSRWGEILTCLYICGGCIP